VSTSVPPLLASLNPAQQEAASCVKGAVLVIAGAGSGKTRALTHRIAHLMADHGVSGSQILAVTFTNKAAAEMRERLSALIKQDIKAYSSYSPTVGTFHSLCVQILRRDMHELGRDNNFVIYDMVDQKAVMRRLFEEAHVDPKVYAPQAVLGAISNAKSHLMSPANYHARGDFEKVVAEIYPRYEKALIRSNAVDFDDLLLLVVRLFQNHPKILEGYQDRWHYISVDEYQDTNLAQAAITNMLAEKYRNLCVIGDPDQSIYSWRGADISNIKDFKKKYPEAKEVTLEQNYRSTKTILAAANAAISYNKSHGKKKLWTDSDEGEKIFRLELPDERVEAEFIAQEIENLTKDGEQQYADCTILYRTNAQSRTLEETFLRHGIPHKIIGGVKFYERKEIKDVLAYLKLITNPADDVGLTRIINVPSRKIGAKTVEYLRDFAQQHDQSLSAALAHARELAVPAAKQEILIKFGAGMEYLRKQNLKLTAAGMIKTVVSLTKLRDFWNMEGKDVGEARWENVQELVNVAAKYDALEPGISLATFLEEIALIADSDQLPEGEEQPNQVKLMTLHTAKGLEFPIVFMVGLEQNMFPHSRSQMDPKQLEEERRLFYVGITRARERLYMTNARSRMFFGEINNNAPSEFLETIPAELLASGPEIELKKRGYGERIIPMESDDSGYYQGGRNESAAITPVFDTGDRVRHAAFGDGTVVSVTGGIAEISFPCGTKRLALSIAPLTKI